MLAVEFEHDRQQLLIPVSVGSPETPSRLIKTTALIDTGATVTGVSRAVADQISLPRRGKQIITTVSGEHVVRLYRMVLGFYPANAMLPTILPNELLAIECSSGSAFEVLIGMDVLGRSHLETRPNATGILRVPT